MKLPLLALLVVGVLLSLSAQTLDDLEFGSPERLEIATWNIEWFPKDGATTVNAVHQIIENLEIDLWAIQEIDDTTAFKNMVDGMESYEYILMNGWFGGLVYVYNANQIDVLDAYEIYTESPYWSPLPRSPLVLRFAYNGEVFNAINNHFKCCGDGTIDWSDDGDEEMRRLEACVLIESYISEYLELERVILLGDLNDLIAEAPSSNVFQPFLDVPEAYLFVDMLIAEGPNSDWSFPGWPSHLDHILITDELFSDFSAAQTVVTTLDIAAHMPGGWSEYDQTVSDHRPVVMSIVPSPLGNVQLGPQHLQSEVMFVMDMLGRKCSYAPGKLLLYHFQDGTTEKHWSLAPWAPE